MLTKHTRSNPPDAGWKNKAMHLLTAVFTNIKKHAGDRKVKYTETVLYKLYLYGNWFN